MRTLLSCLLIASPLMTGTGCSVLGAAIGSGFNSPPLEHSAEDVGSEILGTWAEFRTVNGGRYSGTVSVFDDEWIVLTNDDPSFWSAEPETLRRDAIGTVLTESRDGARRGFAIGLVVDFVYVALLIVGLSHLEMPSD